MSEHTHDWQSLGKCSHAAERGQTGEAFQCACGALGHRWQNGFSCTRLTGARRQTAIAEERKQCPLAKLREQQAAAS